MEIVQALATVIAFIVDGVWTYRLFIQQRQEQPRLKIEHKISQQRLPSGQTLLSIDEVLSNPGTTLVTLHDSDTRIIRVFPLPSGITKEEMNGPQQLPEIVRRPDKWPVLRYAQRQFPDGDRVLEPGEEDQLHAEFMLPTEIQVVCVASHVTNPKNPKLGWQRITIYNISEPLVKKEEQKRAQKP